MVCRGIGWRDESKAPDFRISYPPVMLTSESKDFRRKAGKAAGASEWIVKPFRADQLLAVAKRFLG